MIAERGHTRTRAVMRSGAASSPVLTNLCKVVLPIRSSAQTSCARRLGSIAGETTDACCATGESVVTRVPPERAAVRGDGTRGFLRESICVLGIRLTHVHVCNIQTQNGFTQSVIARHGSTPRHAALDAHT